MLQAYITYTTSIHTLLTAYGFKKKTNKQKTKLITGIDNNLQVATGYKHMENSRHKSYNIDNRFI
jgi:hypothetical protein